MKFMCTRAAILSRRHLLADCNGMSLQEMFDGSLMIGLLAFALFYLNFQLRKQTFKLRSDQLDQQQRANGFTHRTDRSKVYCKKTEASFRSSRRVGKLVKLLV